MMIQAVTKTRRWIGLLGLCVLASLLAGCEARMLMAGHIASLSVTCGIFWAALSLRSDGKK